MLPHRVCESTCYVNGLEDLAAWRGADYADFLLSVVGGMAGFTYLRFKRADPPCMVYWGANPKYLMKDLAGIIGFEETVIEGKTFKNTFPRLKEFIGNGQPVMAGALDMYYLRYCSISTGSFMFPFIMSSSSGMMMRNALFSYTIAAIRVSSKFRTMSLRGLWVSAYQG
jgi:hypothetical protein